MTEPASIQRNGIAELSHKLADAFSQAGNIAGFGYRIGGVNVRLRCGGARLAERLTPALAHLAAPLADEPEITVCAADAGETGAALPVLPGDWPRIWRAAKCAVTRRTAFLSHTNLTPPP